MQLWQLLGECEAVAGHGNSLEPQWLEGLQALHNIQQVSPHSGLTTCQADLGHSCLDKQPRLGVVGRV
jgi:hypothetical protein